MQWEKKPFWMEKVVLPEWMTGLVVRRGSPKSSIFIDDFLSDQLLLVGKPEFSAGKFRPTNFRRPMMMGTCHGELPWDVPKVPTFVEPGPARGHSEKIAK